MREIVRRSLPLAIVGLVAAGCSSAPAADEPDYSGVVAVKGESGPEMVADAGLGLLCIVGAVVAIATAPIWIPIVLISGAKFGFMPPPGRPFRKDGRARTAELGAGDEWLVSVRPEVLTLALHEREELAGVWLAEARGEHASIAAFSQLSLDLIAVGAPPSLLEKTHKAALDEVVHAKLCFAFASAYAGREIAPAEFPAARAASRPFTTLPSFSLQEEIARLAKESLEDGCLDEGFSAAVAREARDAAKDDAVRAALAVIARDEARHEALAWEIVEWCVEKGAGDAVLAAAEELASSHPLDARVEGGRLSADRTRDLRRDQRAFVSAHARALCAVGL